MSFILDALDRSRRERDARSVDPILSPAADAPVAQSRRVRWVTILLLALVSALAVIAWLGLFRPQGAGPAADAAAVPAVVAVPTTPPPLSAAAAPQAVPLSREFPAADTPPEPPATDVSRLYSAAREARDLAPEEDVAVADAEVEALVARAQAAMDNLDLAEHPAPMLEDLSQAVRDDIPTLIYSQHDYQSMGEASSVFINRERRRVGDSVAGLHVQEILPDSVVLEYQGTVFRLRALNSWVNL